VSPAADPTTRQLPIEVRIDNRERQLVAGLFAEGRIFAFERRAVLAPAAAIGAERGGASSLVLRGGRLTRVAVEVGARHPEQALVEITSGLTPGDTVLVGSAQGIAAGAVAKIK
jgi:multidrug efflux pump subunit AcrA (membrane-fusion protein)